jgi:hypothetical protein
VTPGNINKNKSTRNNNNFDNEEKNLLNLMISKESKPKSREELLAFDIAKELNDLKSLSIYLSYAQKYPEGLLMHFLGEIKELPLKKIKKSRAALFNYLVKKYAKKVSKNNGN